MPVHPSHRSSYSSVSLRLPLTADAPTSRLFRLLHFCLSKNRDWDRFILGLCSPALCAGMGAASLIFLGMARVCGNMECLTLSLGGHRSFFYYMWLDAMTPASIGVAPSSGLTQKSKALHQAQGFVYIKIWSLRAAAGCRADSRPTSTSSRPHQQNSLLQVTRGQLLTPVCKV